MAKSKCARGMTKSGRCKRKPGRKRGSRSRKMRKSRRRCKYGKLKQPIKTKSGKRRCKKKRSRKSRKSKKSRRKYKYSDTLQRKVDGILNQFTPEERSYVCLSCDIGRQVDASIKGYNAPIQNMPKGR